MSKEEYLKSRIAEKSLEDQASIISKWSMSYLDPLLIVGSKKSLENEHCGPPYHTDKANYAYERINKCWNEQCEKDKPSFALALLNAFGKYKFLVAAGYAVISAVFFITPVLLVEDLVKFIEKGGTIEQYPDGYAHPWIEVLGLFIFPAIAAFVQNRSIAIMTHFSTFSRSAISTLVYNKVLRVSPSGSSLTGSGKVMNLMSNDAMQLQKTLLYFSFGVVAPFMLVISIWLIYRLVGHATWVGVGLLLVSAPLSAICFAFISKFRKSAMTLSDLRMNLIGEVLTGIRIIKYNAWEKPYQKEITKLRSKELKYLKYVAWIVAVGFSITLVSIPIVQPVAVFYTYVKLYDTPLTASTAFTTLILFNMLKLPFQMFPAGLVFGAQCLVAFKRIEKYLLSPEISKYVLSEPHPEDSSTTGSQIGSITMKNCSFDWVDKEYLKNDENKKSEKRTLGFWRKSPNVSPNMDFVDKGSDVAILKNITCEIKAGSLVAVVGAVGSGKSSFLSAILGEMEPLYGSKVYIPQNDCSSFFGFCSQTPWVINDTLRGNITFGRSFKKERYELVVEACALNDDIAILPGNDLTEIGERGINLSGGQKARVSLARALYSEDTKILLLDDPLSAVDGHVGEHLFTNAINGNIVKERGITRILVTHHTQHLQHCDLVIVLEDGEIKHQGQYNELVNDGVDFHRAVDTGEEKKEEEDSDCSKNNKKSDVKALISKEEEEIDDFDVKDPNYEMDVLKTTEEEERERGSVGLQKYLHYAKSGGYINLFLFLAFQVAGRATEVLGTFWLAFWSDEIGKAENLGQSITEEETTYFVSYYAMISGVSCLLLLIRAIFHAILRVNAAAELHDGLLNGVLSAPISFFDVTPTGRILNRFAADMDRVDHDIPATFIMSANVVIIIVASFFAMIVSTKGCFIIVFVPIIFMYNRIQIWFRRTSTELQRVSNINNSPIFADFAQAISGASTIRAYKDESRFIERSKTRLDLYSSSYTLVQHVATWLSIRLDISGAVIQAFIAGVSIATAKYNIIPAGWLGVGLTLSAEVTLFLKQAVRVLSKFEADMSSVERIAHYIKGIPEEAPDIIPDNDPDPKFWPSNGVIEFNKCNMRYRDGPLVLKDITVRIKGGEKIGVVGRTGSGKSSLVNMLFRIHEIDGDGGTIIIDGIDVSNLGTEVLRQNMCIIPQDPIMFSNTIRYNIDPFHRASDDELWDSLEMVQLAETVRNLRDGLDEQVTEGGDNFSQGQRQLLCIARALLRKPRILVMDEATASIDNKTDAHIQQMIRENFSEATILTIAHRINTIMDNDRILVLDQGHVTEFNTPEELLKKEDGIFRSMVDKWNQKHSDGSE